MAHVVRMRAFLTVLPLIAVLTVAALVLQAHRDRPADAQAPTAPALTTPAP